MPDLIDRHSSGVFVIAATPFNEEGVLDFESIDRMVDFYLGCGVSGMTILGIMGEAPKLSAEESLAFTRRVIDRTASRVPIVVGVSGGGLDPMRALAHTAMGAGAAGRYGRAARRAPGLRIGSKAISGRSARRSGRTFRSACRTIHRRTV